MTITQYIIKDSGGKDVVVNKSSPDNSWRLVHNGGKIISLFAANGFTETKNTLFLAATWQECIDEAKRVGLTNIQGFIQQALKDQLEQSYKAIKTKGESQIDFVSLVLSKTTSAESLISEVNTAVAAISASRPGTKPPKTTFP